MQDTREQRTRLVQRLADLLAVAVVVADIGGSALFANQAWVTMTGQDDEQWRDQGWFGVLGADCRDAHRSALLVAMRSANTYHADWIFDVPVRGQRILRVVAAPDLIEGTPEGFVATVTDVTEERSREQRLSHLASHDQLTGLYRRDQFLDFVGRALERQRRLPRPLTAVFFIDVDDLKATNDRLGHNAGDRLLRTVAARISATVRTTDVVARYGGDEFAVLCEELPNEDEAALLADRIRAAVSETEAGDEPVSISIGTAFALDPDVGPAAILDLADQAMYLTRKKTRAKPDLYQTAGSGLHSIMQR